MSIINTIFFFFQNSSVFIFAMSFLIFYQDRLRLRYCNRLNFFLFSSQIELCAFSRDFKMNRITVFLLQLIIVVIGCANSENVATPKSTSYEKFVYQVSVQNSSNRHICNGVILNRNFILTLGQCVSNYTNAGELKVFYGSNRLNHNGSYNDVKQIYIHPGFNRTIIRNDIALLLTATDITFIANVSKGQLIYQNMMFQ